MHPDLPTPDNRHLLGQAGAWLLAAAALWWVAAVVLIPADDYFLGETARDEARSIAEHAAMFRTFHLVALLGVAAAAAGVLALARSFRDGGRSVLVRIARGLALVGLAGWTAEVLVRLTAGVSRARDVVAGSAAVPDEPAIGSWILFGVAALGFVAPMLCAWALARRHEPSKRASMVVAVLVSLVTLAGVATLAPSVVYQFGALVLSLPLLLSHRSARAPGVVPARAGMTG